MLPFREPYSNYNLNSKLVKSKIPNSKHQITNKSQIPISNDQNIQRYGITSHCKHRPIGLYALSTTIELSVVWNFEFGLLEFICARPGATWLVYTIIRVGLGGGAINTSGVNSVWARDLGFGAWNFSRSDNLWLN